MGTSSLVILGGGFAGTTLARRLESRLPANWDMTLVSQENCITYHPLLAEVVGASMLPGHVVAPIRQMVKPTRFSMAVVTEIDFDRRELRYVGEVSGVIPYDQLVLACGMTINLDVLPGMAENSLPLKTAGDALFLRNRILVRMEEAEMQGDPVRRRWLTTFIVVGGGFSGVEVAGEINDFVRSSLRYYPKIDGQDCRVILLHGGDRILPELPAGLAEFALMKMQKRGIGIHLSTLVARADDRGVELQSGERIDGGTIIGTVGTAPTEMVERLPLPKQRGRIETAADMSVPDYPGVWAIGDCAAVVNAHDGRLSPPTAQFATRQAEQLAENLMRSLRGEPTRVFSYKSRGQFATIGHQKAVAEVFGVRLSGLMAWVLRRGVYLANFPTLARKVRVLVEWIWTCLFPPDIAHLSFVRTRPSRTPGPISDDRGGDRRGD
ncbi:MAG: NAD(P)/FAD-dependent oxidoreductase [Gemmatimonadetes bacterium]|nr:NAD(P)/FAD-dependent oxidoreductase [Gemmatimonadota bacterium]